MVKVLENNGIVVPKGRVSDYRSKLSTQEDLEAFKRSYDCIHNPFFRETIFRRQATICPICGETILDLWHGCNVHHQSYNYICGFKYPVVKIHTHMTKKGNLGFNQLPHCELCYVLSPDKFNKCISHCVILHTECHAMIHNKGKKHNAA